MASILGSSLMEGRYTRIAEEEIADIAYTACKLSRGGLEVKGHGNRSSRFSRG